MFFVVDAAIKYVSYKQYNVDDIIRWNDLKVAKYLDSSKIVNSNNIIVREIMILLR